MCGRPEPPTDKCMRTSGISLREKNWVLVGELCKCANSMCNRSKRNVLDVPHSIFIPIVLTWMSKLVAE